MSTYRFIGQKYNNKTQIVKKKKRKKKKILFHVSSGAAGKLITALHEKQCVVIFLFDTGFAFERSLRAKPDDPFLYP